MRQVRIASRTEIANRLFTELARRYPRAAEAELRRAVRLNVELSLAVIEMMLEEPDTNPEETSADFSRLLASFYSNFA